MIRTGGLLAAVAAGLALGAPAARGASVSGSVTAAASPPARIAFVSDRDGNREIYVMGSDGSGQKDLSNTPANDLSPAWSPDGRRIAFARDDGTSLEVFVMNSDGTGQTDLTNAADDDDAPAWSPDGGQIAFVSTRSGGAEVWVMRSDGADPTQVTSTGGHALAPAWSPDGKLIAYWSDDDVSIHTIAPDGTGDQVVGGAGDGTSDDEEPAWSPDGRTLAFASFRDPDQLYDIWTMGTDGSGQAALFGTPAREVSPAWSPDGRRLAFASDQAGDFNIYAMAADGTGVTRITDDPASDTSPTWGPPADPTPGGSDGGGSGAAPGARGHRPRVTVHFSRARIAVGRRIAFRVPYRLARPATVTLEGRLRGHLRVRVTRRGRAGANVLEFSRPVRHPAAWRGRWRLRLIVRG